MSQTGNGPENNNGNQKGNPDKDENAGAETAKRTHGTDDGGPNKTQENIATTKRPRSTRADIASNFIQTLIFIAIAVQLYFFERQIGDFEKQISLMQSGLKADFLQKLNDDKKLFESVINNPDGVIQTLRADDKYCQDPAGVSASQQQAVDILARQMMGFYERYYLIAEELGLASDWSFICKDAKRVSVAYCHLGEKMAEVKESATPEFKEAYETCDLK